MNRDAVVHINPESLHSSPGFTWAVRVPAGAEMIYIGGLNGVGPDGQVVGPGFADQTRQVFANLTACLEAAGADITNVVKWTILAVAGSSVEEGFAVFGEVWPRDAAPPAITVAFVSSVGPPGALLEIEAVAAILAR